MTVAETHEFQAEVNEVLSLVVNSLYSHREVFLRELVSNASDALDKLSFRALTEHTLLGDEKELRIELVPDRDRGTLVIRDNGIGMTKAELIANLGTIARSGSREMLRALAPEQRGELSLIGQFGVGFYSAYLVADRVRVTSRAAGSDEGWVWASDAKGKFTLEPAPGAPRGSSLELQLKEGAKEFLDEWRLRELVRRYSDYVRWPIRLQVTRPAEKDQPATTSFETINSASALWTRPKSEISDEQYVEFYKHLSHDWEAPLAWTHFKVEGAQELTGLLFVPGHAPFDLFERKARGVRLYVKRVFIMEDCEVLLPEWLRFVRGVVDSQDLPLNVSRELLQQDQITALIRKQVVGKTLSLLEELAGEGESTRKDADGGERKVDRYVEFWNLFGRVLKEGVHHDFQQRERIAALLRFHSTFDEKLASLGDYVGRMLESQPGIYYLTAASLPAAQQSPLLETLRKRGYEVLLMTDPVDEWVVDALREFQGKRLISVAKGDLELPLGESEQKAREERSAAAKDLCDRIARQLGDVAQEVRVSDRLTESPACLVTEQHGLSPHVARILRANGQDVPEPKRILELNPDHPFVRKLASAGDEQFQELTDLLYDQALLAEGSLPRDPAAFARRLSQLLGESG